MNRDRIARTAWSELERFHADTSNAFHSDDSGPHAVLLALASNLKLTVKEDPLLVEPAIGEYNADLRRISIRPGLEPGRRNFTVAHEIGHAVLHPDDSAYDDEDSIDESADLTAKDELVFRSYDAKSRQELEANSFAASLLAPMVLVRQRIESDPNWTVEALATYFGLSRSAMVSQIAATFLPGPREAKTKPKTVEVTLDDYQKDACEATTPALVLAGPGAGKTRVLVDRFQWLVNRGVNPGRILALTFSNKAAGEMVERLSQALGETAKELSVSTFHSFGVEILKAYGDRIGFKERPRLLTPADAFVLLKQNLASVPLGSFEDLRRPTMHLRLLMSAISRAKDELVDPDSFRTLAEKWLAEVTNLQGDPAEAKAARQSVDAAEFYSTYEELLRDGGYADFGDLISLTVKLLELPELGQTIREKYDHILVDETQDVNYATTQMLKLLDGGRGIIWAVGDPRQSIYRFRGASAVSLNRFKEDYPGARIVELKKNYRSIQDIVHFSQAHEIPKREAGDDLPIPVLESGRDPATGTSIEIIAATDQESEVASIAARIAVLSESASYSDIAVLTRTRAQARIISDSLLDQGIPTTWAGPLESRPAFKKVMGALLLSADDVRGIVRFWTGSDCDLRLLAKWARENKAWSASHLLHEASEGKVDGLSEIAQTLCKELRSLIGFLRSFDTCGRVVERYIFDRCDEFRKVLLNDTPAGKRIRATLGDVLALVASYSQGKNDFQLSSRSFVDYIRSSLEAGELRDLGDAGESNAVAVQTMHASKGLEWPVVFLPFIAATKMPPNRKNWEQIPIPRGLIKGEDPQDGAIEQANLFYVALTRPQDRLILSYADKYGRFNAGESPFLSTLLAGLGKSGQVERSDAPTVSGLSENAMPTTEGFKFDGPILYQALKTVEDCPKQFEYRYILRLFDDETGYRDFQRSIKATRDWIYGIHDTGGTWSDGEVTERFRQEWKDRKPTGHWYEERYLEQGEKYLLELSRDLREGRPRPNAVEFALEEDGRTVLIPVDDIVEGGDNGPIILRKFEFGKFAESHGGKPRIVLMKAAGDDSYAGRTVQPQVFYPLTGEALSPEFTQLKLKNARKKVGELIQRAENGPYYPDPNLIRCRSCPWSSICPTEPQDDAD